MYKLLSIILFAYGLALTTDEIYDNSWALIIGINKYENVQKLDFAADDAIAMKEILIESFNFPEENVTMLLNQEATKDNIVKEFSNIAFKAQERDRVLVFFAGHGETMELPEGGQMGYLIPVNGDADNLYYSSIAMDELNRLALMSKAKHMLYLVDACYGGIAAVGSRGLSKNTPNYIDKIISGKSRQIITAGGKGEQVIEKSEWGHSAFTLNLKRGLKDKRADLNSDGYITANELGMFLSERVTIDSDNQQTPQYGRMTSQEGEFVFVLNAQTMNRYLNEKTESLDSKSTPNYIEKITKNKSRQIITAGGKGEEVIEKSEWGHSAFTLNLNRGLKHGNADMNADGYITANELGLFLSQKVTIDSDNQQTPQYGRMTSQEGEFVFVYSENTVINQNVGDKSMEEKLDLLLSKIEKLESQPKNNKKLTHLEATERLQELEQMYDDSIQFHQLVDENTRLKKAVEKNEELLNNERHDIGINVFGLGLFSGSDKKIINEQVKGGFLLSIFGNAKLNLVDAKLYKEKNIINIIVLFGG